MRDAASGNESPEAVSYNGSSSSVGIESSEQPGEAPVAEISVSDFDCEVTYSAPTLRPEDAQKAFIEAFEKNSYELPFGETVSAIAARTLATFVPFWKLAGQIEGSWTAKGVTVNEREVNCAACNGKGVKSKSVLVCRKCDGTGKVTHTTKNRFPEEGVTTVQVDLLVTNVSSDINIKLKNKAEPAVQPVVLPRDNKASLRCIQPKSQSIKVANTKLSTLLFRELERKATEKHLKKYDQVGDFHVDADSSKTEANVGVYIHPVYLCWYKTGETNYFAVCDAISGKVTLPSPPASNSQSTSAPLESGSSQGKRKPVRLLYLIIGTCVFAAILIGVLSDSKGISSDIPAPAIAATNTPPTSLSKRDETRPTDSNQLAETTPRIDEGVLIAEAWRENLIALNLAYGKELSKYAAEPIGEAGARAENARFEQERERNCGPMSARV